MKRVQQALAAIGIPVMAGVWRSDSITQSSPEQYVVYSTTMSEYAHEDDAASCRRTFVYMNLWSNTDPTEMADTIRQAMYAADFYLVEETDRGYNQPAYDTATRTYTVFWTWVCYFAFGFKSEKADHTFRYVWLLKVRAKPLTENYATKEGSTINRQTPEVEWTAIKRTHDGQYQYVADEGQNSFTTEKAATFLESVYTPTLTAGDGG